jgi:hypothetical protein
MHHYLKASVSSFPGSENAMLLALKSQKKPDSLLFRRQNPKPINFRKSSGSEAF